MRDTLDKMHVSVAFSRACAPLHFVPLFSPAYVANETKTTAETWCHFRPTSGLGVSTSRASSVGWSCLKGVRCLIGNLRNLCSSVEQNAVVELFLVAEADIVITSPKSSFSALAAAAGGRSTQRVGESYVSILLRVACVLASATLQKA